MKNAVRISESIAAIVLATILVSACGGASESTEVATTTEGSLATATEVGLATTTEDGLEDAARRRKRTLGVAAGATSTTVATAVTASTGPAATPAPTTTTTKASTPTAAAATVPTPSKTAVTVPTQTVTAAATITLSSLPAKTTTATNASIGYKLITTDPSYAVNCRRDSYTPIDCPNPFVLGQTTALEAGVHKVEYFVDRGTGIDLTKPDASYSWTVEAAASTASATLSATPSATISTSTAFAGTALAALPGSASVASANGSDGQPRFSKVLDPNGSGRTVNVHRIYGSDPKEWGGQRAEIFYNATAGITLPVARDFWMSFATNAKAGEALVPGTSFDDSMLVFQTHTPQPGDTQPDISLSMSGVRNTMRWRVAYNTSGNVAGNGWMSTEGNPVVHEEAMPAPGVWYRYVVHYRPGYTTAHNPRFRVWRAKPGGAFEQLFDHTGFNTYNTSKTGAGPSYPRIGPYKWSTWNQASIAWYLTPLHFGEGADLLEAAKASLSGL